MVTKEIKEGKIWAFLAMLFPLFGFILVFLFMRDNVYANYYAKQALVLFLFGVIVSWIPLINIIGWLIYVVLWFWGWINALSGKKVPLPLIGHFADKFDL